MKNYQQAFTDYLKSHPTDRGESEAEELLDVLFRCYQESRKSDSDDIRIRFNDLDDILSKLPLEENDRVFLLTCELCDLHSKDAFQAGTLTGFHLFRELTI